MRQYKLDNFKAHRGFEFPDYEELNAKDCRKLQIRICERLQLPSESSGLMVVNRLRQSQRPASGPNCGADEFDFSRLFEEIGVKLPEELFVNWFQFDEIDCITFSHVREYLSDIWYPSTDDIDLFDSSLAWIVSIDEGGRCWSVMF